MACVNLGKTATYKLSGAFNARFAAHINASGDSETKAYFNKVMSPMLSQNPLEDTKNTSDKKDTNNMSQLGDVSNVGCADSADNTDCNSDNGHDYDSSTELEESGNKLENQETDTLPLFTAGAVLVTVRPSDGVFGALLGYQEKGERDAKMFPYPGYWTPHKGRMDESERGFPKKTAIREVFEETAGLVSLEEKDIEFCYTLKPNPSEKYLNETNLALVMVPYSVLTRFAEAREQQVSAECKEKLNLAFFPIQAIRRCNKQRGLATNSFVHQQLAVSGLVSSFFSRRSSSQVVHDLSWKLANERFDELFKAGKLPADAKVELPTSTRVDFAIPLDSHLDLKGRANNLLHFDVLMSDGESGKPVSKFVRKRPMVVPSVGSSVGPPADNSGRVVASWRSKSTRNVDSSARRMSGSASLSWRRPETPTGTPTGTATVTAGPVVATAVAVKATVTGLRPGVGVVTKSMTKSTTTMPVEQKAKVSVESSEVPLVKVLETTTLVSNVAVGVGKGVGKGAEKGASVGASANLGSVNLRC
jgi:hypothetical protein